MDLLKALKRTTIISATALLAFGATEASAADNVSSIGHISASVQGTLSIAETSAMNFGNFSVTCTGGTCNKTGSIVLGDAGTRTASGAVHDVITLLNGANSVPAGITNGTNLETGAQRPGFFAITGGAAGNVYISFADNTGAIIDSSYDPANHPGNYVTLTGPTANAFTVDSFTFETDAGAGAEGTGGYTQQSGHTTDIYGSYVTLGGATATLRVGATLHTATSVTPVAGHYTGTYYVMASY